MKVLQHSAVPVPSEMQPLPCLLETVRSVLSLSMDVPDSGRSWWRIRSLVVPAQTSLKLHELVVEGYKQLCMLTAPCAWNETRPSSVSLQIASCWLAIASPRRLF